MTKSKAIKRLNQRAEPFSLSTNVTQGKVGEVTVKAVLSLMQPVKDLGGKTIQQVDRQVAFLVLKVRDETLHEQHLIAVPNVKVA